MISIVVIYFFHCYYHNHTTLITSYRKCHADSVLIRLRIILCFNFFAILRV